MIELSFMTGNWFVYKEQKLFVTRSGYTGEDGFEVSVPNNLAEEFTKKLIELRTKQFNKKQTSSITFYDRGVHETLAYLNYIGLNYSNKLTRKCRTIKYDMVFILPPWEKIYIQDNCRYESFDQAKKIYREIVKIYEYFNMRIIFLEKDSIENRVKEILIHVKQ